MTDPLHIALAQAVRHLDTQPQRYELLFERGDLEIEIYAPRGVDPQGPHDRDEVYLISSGSGVFRRGEDTVAFNTGDFLFVAAHVPHKFESFSDDFSTWVIFFGPKGGVKG